VATRLGGQIATAIAAVQRWGLSTRYIGSAGDDGSAELHLREFKRLGTETHVRMLRHTPSRASYILVDELTGSRTVLWRRDHRLELKAPQLRKEWITRSSMLLIDGENPRASRAAARWARLEGIPVVCDFDASTVEADSLLHDVDLPVISSELTLRLAQEANYLRALPLLMHRYKSRLICTTLSEHGALAWDGEQFWYAPAFQVRAVDTTGAGDLFHAGFAFGLIRKWSWQKILDFACAAAALNCTAEGARGCIGSVRHIQRLSGAQSRHPSLFSQGELAQAAHLARHRGV
jgi:sulfofructose kinase